MLLSGLPTAGLIAIIAVCVVLILLIVCNIRVVSQTNKYIVQRMGGYHTTWGVGIHFLIPIIDRVAKVVSMKEQVKDFDPQSVITKDNVTMQIDTIVFYQVTDPKTYTYGVVSPEFAIENLSATTLRNIIGELDLDQTLTSRDIINEKMRQILDEATDAWGIKVNRVELKNILPPKDIRDSMEKQMRAERERREQILRAEGEKSAAILRAEGEKQSAILRAEGEKEQMVRLAEGQAEAVRINKEAEALGIKLIREAEADEAVLRLKSYETFAKVAEGQATKIIIPSDIQDLTSLFVGVKEAASSKANSKDTVKNK